MGEPTTARKVRNVEEAGILLAEWETSGESMVRWCETRGLNWFSLAAFKGQVTRERVPFSPQLVELAAVEGPRCPTDRRSWYRVATDRSLVEVTDDFRDDTLRRLLRVVSAW